MVVAAIGMALFLTEEGSDTIYRQAEEPVQISFSWWGNDNRHEYTLQGIHEFEMQHPGIDVQPRFGVWNGFTNRTKMAMNSETNADVMQINYAWLRRYSADGTGYYDLERFRKYIDLDNYEEDDLEFGRRNGILNALPIAYNVDTALYNKDLFDSFGLDIPQTWDDLFACAGVMRERGIYPMSAVKKHMWLMLLAWYEQTYGHPAFSEDGTCQMQENEVEAVLTFYRRLIDEKVCPPLDDADSAFLNRSAAGIICWISDTDRYGNVLIRQGTNVVPGTLFTNGVSDAGWYMKPATMYAISRTTRHPVEAAKLLGYLVEDGTMAELMGTEKGIPINKKAYETLKKKDSLSGITEDAQEVFLKERDSLSAMPAILEDETVIAAFKSASDKYLYDQDTIANCAGEILRAAQAGSAA